MTLPDEERFHHDRSRYERPNLKYRCGRGAVWDKPCMLGPSHDGQCGGLYECRPQKRGDDWSCSRPESEGGSCAEGPSPDGACSQYRPPCVPRRTLRNYRGIMALAALVAVAALIAAFHDVRTLGVGPFGAADAGPLTSAHANFTSKEGCGACHEAHGAGPLQWLAGAFRTSDMTATCLECHSFTGPERNPHNLTLAALGVGADAASEPGWAVDSLACNACHTEHKGAQADISQLSGAQCATCHKVKFATFDEAHPPFSPNYPHDRRTSIRFDHVTHFKEHFTNERVADVAPDLCVDCHAIAAAERNVPPKGFEESCAACHATEMAARDMVFLMLPEFSKEPLKRDDIRAACGLTPDEFGAVITKDDPSEFGDTLSTIGAYLLGVYPGEPDDYGPRMGALILAMAEDGTAPLTDLLAERTSGYAAAMMLHGLGAELAQQVACAWGANLEYEAPQKPPAAGWYGDFIELKYRPSGHSDPIVRAWLDFALAAVHQGRLRVGRPWLDFALAAVDQEKDEKDLELAEALRDELIDPKKGAGACTKCHAVSAVTTPSSGDETGTLAFEWTYQENIVRPFDVYSHAAHIRLVNPDGVSMLAPMVGCATCHELNAAAEYPASFGDFDSTTYSSNFFSVRKETCAQCHAADRIRQDCQLCHVYHREPGLNPKVTSAMKDAPHIGLEPVARDAPSGRAVPMPGEPEGDREERRADLATRQAD